MTDPYAVLGVGRDASQDDIKKAYRALAKALHPDANPGNAAVEERFKRVSAAYAVLSDPEARARYDRGEIDGSGQERGFDFRAAGGGFAGNLDIDDLFGNLFGGHFDRARRDNAGGRDVEGAITIDFIEAARGGTRRVAMPGGRMLDVSIPAGIENGQTIRLKGQGSGAGARVGDALIRVAIDPHPTFARDGHDVVVELPVSVPEAMLGARVEVPTVDGPVTVTVPAGSNAGDVLRLRGRGLDKRGGPRGDQLVRLKVMLPKTAGPALTDLVRRWARDHAYDVR